MLLGGECGLQVPSLELSESHLTVAAGCEQKPEVTGSVTHKCKCCILGAVQNHLRGFKPERKPEDARPSTHAGPGALRYLGFAAGRIQPEYCRNN